MIHISAAQLQSVVSRIFVGVGIPVDNAEAVAASLVQNDLVGHTSHGVLRVESYVQAVERGRVDPHGIPQTLRQSATTALIDGGRNLGQVVGWQAMDLAMEKAAQHDLGMVAVRNCGHTGRLGEYVVRAAEKGYMGLAFGSGSAKGGLVAPFLGTDRTFNTNPISWGVPAGEHPPVFMDYATSACSFGKLQAAMDKGVTIPTDWLLDSEGRPTTDPGRVYEGGVLVPFGLHKGYGLCFMVEALAGGLTGVSCAALESYRQEFALVLMAVNIAAFQPLDEFRAMIDELVAAVKNGRKAEGVEEILVPGEPEWRAREKNLRDGLDLPESAWERIVAAGERHGVAVSL